jgi:hypothetical protein
MLNVELGTAPLHGRVLNSTFTIQHSTFNITPLTFAHGAPITR